MPKARVAFGPWKPDSVDRDSTDLKEARNTIPLFQGYRPLPALQVHSRMDTAASDADPLTGGHVHLLDSDLAIILIRPDGDDNVDTPYQNEKGETTNLYLSIDEESPDPADYVLARSSSTESPGGDTLWYAATLSDPSTTPVVTTGHILRFQYAVFDPNDIGWTIKVSLSEGGTIVDPGASPVTKTITGTGSVGETVDSLTLSGAQAGAITDYTDLEVRYQAYYGSNFNFQANYPSSTVENPGGWTIVGAQSTLEDSVGDAGTDTDYIQSKTLESGNSTRAITFGLDDFVDPVIDYGMFLEIRAQADTAACTLTMELLEADDTVVCSNDFSVTTSWATNNYAITTAEGASITTFAGMKIRLTAKRGAADTKCRVSATWVEVPEKEFILLAQAELELPRATSYVSGDITERYVGTETALYLIQEDTSTWEDVSIAGGYGTGDSPQSWSFCSWGDDVIATNFEDPVQIKTPAASDFANLITSTDKPQGKYVAAVQNHLVLANINDAHADGAPNLIWWSAVDDAASFYPADATTQSGEYYLRETPGAITGLVGGEWGTVFKRNSIHRMNYVGYPFAFGFDLLSDGFGCPFPRSIIVRNQDIWFMGNGALGVIQGGQNVQKFGHGAVRRFLFDTQWESESVDQARSEFDTENDSTVFGAYDSYADLLIWIYRPKGSSFNTTTRYLIYSPTEDRYTHGTIATPANPDDSPATNDLWSASALDLILGEKNTVRDRQGMLKGLLVFSFGAAMTQGPHVAWTLSGPAQMITMQTGILSGSFLAQSEEPVNVQINRVRPILRKYIDDTSITIPTNLYAGISGQITIDTAEDPIFETTVQEIADVAETDEDGWLPVQNGIGGGFFQFTLAFSFNIITTLREILGLEVDFEVLGEH